MKIKFAFIYSLLLIAGIHFGHSSSYSSAVDPYPAIEIPIFEGGYNVKKLFDAARETKFVTYQIQTNQPPTEVLEFYDAFFNGNGWQSAFEICQRNWEDTGNGKKTVAPMTRQLYASWAHPEKNLKAVLWLTYEAEENASQNEVVVQFQLHPKTVK
ncbi:MAG: hypothetical protein PVG59_09190 [Desulfobacterales bacterium]|jgi:hypothetical protein